MKPTVPDLLEALRQSLPKRGRPTGEGWYSLNELAERLGTSRESLRRHLENGLRDGTMETAVGTVPKQGIERVTRFYRQVS